MTLNLVDLKLEYEKDEKLKKSDVDAFVKWAHQQPHLPKINEIQAIVFLQSCYYRNEAAKTALDTYFTIKTLCPDIYGSRNPLTGPAKDTMNVSLVMHLSKKTPEGYSIFFIKLMDLIPDRYVFSDQVRLFDMIIMRHLYQEGTSAGHLIVFDMEGISLSHFIKLSPIIMKKFLYYLQEAMPVRLKGLHFFNIVPFMDKILAMMKPFMKNELMNLLFLHRTLADLIKMIPQDCLPKDYGGSIEERNILHEQMKHLLRTNVALYQWEESQTVDESKRPGKPKKVDDLFGVEGTFKKLEID